MGLSCGRALDLAPAPGLPRDQFSGPWLFSTADARTINSSSSTWRQVAGKLPREGREEARKKSRTLHPPCARWPGTLGSWLAGYCPWVLVWAGACYWNGVGGFMFHASPSGSPKAAHSAVPCSKRLPEPENPAGHSPERADPPPRALTDGWSGSPHPGAGGRLPMARRGRVLWCLFVPLGGACGLPSGARSRR